MTCEGTCYMCTVACNARCTCTAAHHPAHHCGSSASHIRKYLTRTHTTAFIGQNPYEYRERHLNLLTIAAPVLAELQVVALYSLRAYYFQTRMGNSAWSYEHSVRNFSSAACIAVYCICKPRNLGVFNSKSKQNRAKVATILDCLPTGGWVSYDHTKNHVTVTYGKSTRDRGKVRLARSADVKYFRKYSLNRASMLCVRAGDDGEWKKTMYTFSA